MIIKCNIISYSLDDEDLLASSNSGVATRGPVHLTGRPKLYGLTESTRRRPKRKPLRDSSRHPRDFQISNFQILNLELI
jgi:hypothetical protein